MVGLQRREKSVARVQSREGKTASRALLRWAR